MADYFVRQNVFVYHPTVDPHVFPFLLGHRIWQFDRHVALPRVKKSNFAKKVVIFEEMFLEFIQKTFLTLSCTVMARQNVDFVEAAKVMVLDIESVRFDKLHFYCVLFRHSDMPHT